MIENVFSPSSDITLLTINFIKVIPCGGYFLSKWTRWKRI